MKKFSFEHDSRVTNYKGKDWWVKQSWQWHLTAQFQPPFCIEWSLGSSYPSSHIFQRACIKVRPHGVCVCEGLLLGQGDRGAPRSLHLFANRMPRHHTLAHFVVLQNEKTRASLHSRKLPTDQEIVAHPYNGIWFTNKMGWIFVIICINWSFQTSINRWQIVISV